ncbi:hypothetical protein B0J11DRAFT_504534 [Dendryphion nanum]|uniref:Uncharacterized protein n=1 Tax=Dendryphion nanum TaxID=256645 RepID=A0A9P9E4X4_9PLEO|nr:hypothetical protein B0J11DRAFT_504534 [Dendryphion nanum]
MKPTFLVALFIGLAAAAPQAPDIETPIQRRCPCRLPNCPMEIIAGRIGREEVVLGAGVEGMEVWGRTGTEKTRPQHGQDGGQDGAPRTRKRTTLNPEKLYSVQGIIKKKTMDCHECRCKNAAALACYEKSTSQGIVCAKPVPEVCGKVEISF